MSAGTVAESAKTVSGIDNQLTHVKSWQEDLDRTRKTVSNRRLTRLRDFEERQNSLLWRELSYKTTQRMYDKVIPGVVRHDVQTDLEIKNLYNAEYSRTNRESYHLSKTLVKHNIEVQKWMSNMSFSKHNIAHNSPRQNFHERMEEENANVERPRVRHATASHSLELSGTCNVARVDTEIGGRQRTQASIKMGNRQSEGSSPGSTHNLHSR